MAAKEEYKIIVNTWNTYNYSKIYHMIVNWIIKYKDSIQSQTDIRSIATRMSDPTEELQDIVCDFMEGDIYKKLRCEFA
jgi:hypothetical protein